MLITKRRYYIATLIVALGLAVFLHPGFGFGTIGIAALMRNHIVKKA